MTGAGRGEPVLVVEDLAVRFRGSSDAVVAVDGISFTAAAGEVVALVGESGSGKSVTCLAVMGLLDAGAEVTRGRVLYRGEDLLQLERRRRRALSGDRLSMIFQDPMTALNPHLRIATQLTEGLRLHRGLDRRAAWDRVRELLAGSGIPEPERCLRSYPHELSGGMRQRVMIAMALALEPDVLFADEPTTALDVTSQARVIGLLHDLQRRLRTAVVFVSHDLGVVAGIADRVLILYGGRVVEEATAADLFREPRHPYTRGLLASVPRLDGEGRLATIPGTPPRLSEPASGCGFAPRCPVARPDCEDARPVTRDVGVDHRVACPLEPEELP